VVGINTRYNETEIGHVLRKAAPKVLVVAHAFRGLDLMPKARRALEHVDAPRPVVLPLAPPGTSRALEASFDPTLYDLGAGVITVESRQRDVEPVLEPELGSAPVVVAFTTSGSTGLPKVAGHSEAGVLHHVRAVQVSASIDEETVLIAPLPFSGVFGYNPIMSALLAGGQVVLHPAFDEERLLAEMHDFGVTHFVGADDMLVRLRAAWDRRPADLSTWRLLLMADFLGKSTEIAEWASREFGTVAAGVYGSSEVFALLAHWSAGTGTPRQWSGGGVLTSPAYRYRLVDDQGREGAAEGELELFGPTTTDVYLGDEGESVSAFTHDGWFRTGDICRAVDDTAFEYVCRAGDVLRLKGFLVEPAEIESRLLDHRAVEVAKVVGATSPEGEPVAVGFVTLTPEQPPVPGEELLHWCAKSLARFKVPVRIEVLEQMPTVTGTNGAKIKASELRELAGRLLRGVGTHES
jgi:fatty-acyl-CoA synthase